MSSGPLKSNLPEFFQSAGFSGNNTLLDQLEDFELGGLEEDEDQDNAFNVPLGSSLPISSIGSNDLNDEFDDGSFNHFNTMADITKSPSQTKSFSGFMSSQSEPKGKFNALEMLKLEMGLKNVDINENSSSVAMDKTAKIHSIINKTPYNVIMPNNVKSSDNETPPPGLNFLFPGNTHIPPQLPGMAPYQPGVVSQQKSPSFQPPLPSGPPPPPGLQPNSTPVMTTPSLPPHLLVPPGAVAGGGGGLTQNFGFPMPPIPVISTPPPEPKPFVIPRSKFMNTSDMRFVLTKILQPMESPDPYADDFYYIQLNLKRIATAHEKIRKGESHTPLPSFTAPLPTWKDTKDRIKSQILVSQKNLDERTREWEEKEKVLGHQVRSNIARPKEALSLSTLNNTNNTSVGGGGNDSDLTGTDGSVTGMSGGTVGLMFNTRLWTMRRAVQRGHEALHTVQELEHLLRTPVIWGNTEARREVLAEIDAAVELLAQAIGIRSMKALHLIEEGYMGLGYAHGHIDSSADVTIDGALMAALLQSAKGKKLIVRSFGPLPPEKRWLLVPPILTKILQTDHYNSTTEERLAEISLIQTCTTFFKQAYMHTLSLKNQPLPPPSPSMITAATATTQEAFFIRFVKHLLHHFRQCVKSVLVTFMEKNQLRKVLLLDDEDNNNKSNENNNGDGDDDKKKKSKNYRLGLFQALIAVGDQLAVLAAATTTTTESSYNNNNIEEEAEEDMNIKMRAYLATSEDWRQIKETFLTMIDSN